MASEFRTGWPIVSAAAIGAGLGISGLLLYNGGLFQAALAAEIGLSRTAYGIGVFGSTLATAIGVPLIGRLVDRRGPAPVAAVGALFLALGFVALAGLATTPVRYVAIMILIGLLGSGCTPLPFTRAVSAAFDRSRGLALGITQLGIGVSAALVPPLVASVIAHFGWRFGFLTLAGLAVCGIFVALAGLPGRPAVAMQADQTDTAAIRRSPQFRVQLVAFTLMAFAFAGMLGHFVPMLQNAGMPIREAGAVAGTIGLSVIGSRILIGWLADRLAPAWLGCASCLFCAAGCLLLAGGGARAALPGAIALGTAMGAEADLLAIMTARHFPIAVYTRLYAPQYAAFTLAAGVSPMWIGWLADREGGYGAALFCCAALLTLPAILFVWLARQRSNIGLGTEAPIERQR